MESNTCTAAITLTVDQPEILIAVIPLQLRHFVPGWAE